MAKKSKRRAWTSEQVRTLKALAKKKRRAAIIARTLKRTEGATRKKHSASDYHSIREPEILRGFERNLRTGELEAAHVVMAVHEAAGNGPTLDDRNAEGGPYYTECEIKIAVLVAGCSQRSATVLF